ncbi:kinesin-like protein KIF18B [Protobothrops mucrosquamatus]|uniref:kinesin-like protein KIF18B n=1 Tax=Protobothrops mucrosquamatus TaxID=103944 RepID=UPI000775EBF3|nr:kinesin-like protein KIF18B [Protobothrops mucrosquamatus]
MVLISPSEEGNVTVVVRVRPQISREQEGNRQSTVQVLSDNMLVFDPEKSSLLGFQIHESVSQKKGKNMKFIFDRVFGEMATQAEVFENTTKEILNGVLSGYNCSVFAYGATGAGKTYTMLGSEKEPGIMYLTMKELYKKIEVKKEEKLCEVFISYQEVYNEQIYDLLEPKGPLAIREDPEKGILVQGLSVHKPKSAMQVLEMLKQGNLNRTQHPTDMNATSSRSHAIFRICVKQQNLVAGIDQDQLVAKMSLVDLAGSERASAANTKGERLREGANINRSLLALINVINGLADAKSKKAHIPYRDSKLTHLLKDSVGGNCWTIMIAAISPSILSYEDTYNTLKYANRAKEIKLLIKPNVVRLNHSSSKYAAICEQLKIEVADLRGRLRAYEEKMPELTFFPALAPCTSEQMELFRSEEITLDNVVLQKDDSTEMGPSQLLKQNCSRKSHTKEDSERKFECCCPKFSNPIKHQEKVETQLQSMDKEQLKRLVIAALLVAKRQYSWLKVTNLLTPEMIAQFEELTSILHQESHGALNISVLDGHDEEPDVQQFINRNDSLGKVQRRVNVESADQFMPTMFVIVCFFIIAVLPASLTATKHASPKVNPGIQPAEPEAELFPHAVLKTPHHSTKKRKASQSERSISSSQRECAKRCRKACLSSQKVDSLKEWSDFAPVDCTSTPLGVKAKSPRPVDHHTPLYCPSTVTKSRMPLAPPTIQNCSPPQNLNITFDRFEESCPPALKVNTVECPAWESVQHVSNHQSVPFIPRASMPVFIMKGSSIPRATSLASKASLQKRRHTTISTSHLRSSRIGRLQGCSVKSSQIVNAPGRPSGIPAWKWR